MATIFDDNEIVNSNPFLSENMKLKGHCWMARLDDTDIIVGRWVDKNRTKFHPIKSITFGKLRQQDPIPFINTKDYVFAFQLYPESKLEKENL